jgi:hypothetical protein
MAETAPQPAAGLLADHVRRVVDSAPPFSEAQLTRLTVLLADSAPRDAAAAA